MKKILLLSDTHSYIDKKMIKYVKQADEVWHAGDIGDLRVTDTLKSLKQLHAVYGNIDNSQIREEFTEYLKFKCEDVNVWITHIGGYPPKYNHRVYDELKLTFYLDNEEFKEYGNYIIIYTTLSIAFKANYSKYYLIYYFSLKVFLSLIRLFHFKGST